jgi:CRP/FNR family transcriptional regulator
MRPGDVFSEQETDAELVGRELHFQPRAVIFMEGDRLDWIYQVEHGAVMLYKLLPDGRRQVVEVLGPGDVFGFAADPVHDCTAETLTATRCRALDRAAFDGSATLMRRLNARLRAQVCELHDHTLLLGRKSALERIASFLLRCIPGRGRHGCPGPNAGLDRATIRITMSRQEIADYLGLTVETVSRVLGKLKRRGVVSIRNLDEICVHDICQLCRLTGAHLTQGRWCSLRREGLIDESCS